MKKTITTTICLLLIGLPNIFAQPPSLRNKAITLKRVIERNHYAPRAVDDSFSKFVFKDLINSADSRRLFFTANEYKQLESYSLKLDDELRGEGWTFFNQFSAVYKKALLRADSIIASVLKKPFNFSSNESIGIGEGNTFNFAASESDLSFRWSRYLKFAVLEQLYSAVHRDSSHDSRQINTKQEPVVRNKTGLTETGSIKRILDDKRGFENYLGELYLNTIATAFDPHTNYFSQQAKEVFQSAVSSESLSFGVELEENAKGEFIVQSLKPGGPAWKSGEIHKGDELLELVHENGDVYQLAGEELEEVYETLFNPAEEKLSFKIRKSSGVEKTVLLRKEKIDNEENIVRSFVLNGTTKIGYVLLPGFYTEWGNEGGSGCAGDVAKELIKLKKENIEGLILDVRYNGGGSMGEALEMAGIFIDEGPLTGEKEKSGKVIFLKDPNRGTIYSGPMVLLVNGQSASASEMLAASLQDYNRAVIVGGNTYGKATEQQLFFLDTITNSQQVQNSISDAVKITTGKFYRLNGQTAQLKGVTPDISLPDEFEVVKLAEKYYPNALPPDTVARSNYYKPLPPLPLGELARKSNQRVEANREFKDMKKFIADYPAQTGKATIIPLKWEDFEKWIDEKKSAMPETDEEPDSSFFKVENHQQAKQWLATHPEEKYLNDELIKNTGKDIYLQEAYLVLNDLINLKKSPVK